MNLVRLLFGNFHLKLIASLLAAGLWGYAVLERNHTTTIELPVKIGRVAPGMVVAGIDTGISRVQVSAKGWDLLLLRLRQPMFLLNLSGEVPGRIRVKLSQEQSNLPTGVKLITARPEYVWIDLDAEARRPVRVSVPVQGRPAKGYALTGIRVAETVYLIGPQEEVGLYSTVSTESLALWELSTTRQFRLAVQPPAGRKFRCQPESVTVMVSVETEESRVFPDVGLVVFRPMSHSVTVKPMSARITVSGAGPVIRTLTLQDISATLKLADSLRKGNYRLPAEITLPPNVTLVKCEPALFDVEIR